jgi:DNA invertase Pin-like site-specific DNA recombinase
LPLKGAGCERVFEEKASGAKRDRPELAAALSFMRKSDTLVVWKLDRLARSLKQLMETVEDLSARGIGFRSLRSNSASALVTGSTSSLGRRCSAGPSVRTIENRDRDATNVRARAY